MFYQSCFKFITTYDNKQLEAIRKETTAYG